MLEDPNPNAVETPPGEGEPETPETPAAPATPPDTTDWKAEFLKAKPKIELANRVLAEQEERDRRAGESPGHTPAAEGSPRSARLTEIRKRVEPLAPTDPVAALAVELLDEFEDREVARDLKTADAFTLSKVPEDQHGALLQFYNRNRSHFGSLAAARDAFDKRATQAENERLRKENEQLKKGKGAVEEGPKDTARTLPPASAGGGRDTTTPQQKAQPMSRDEFDNRVQELYDAGDAHGARMLQRQLREHKIVLRR